MRETAKPKSKKQGARAGCHPFTRVWYSQGGMAGSQPLPRGVGRVEGRQETAHRVACFYRTGGAVQGRLLPFRAEPHYFAGVGRQGEHEFY